MTFSAKCELSIPFHDVDIMHIAWHGHYLKYFELARTALMQSLNLDWPYLKDIGVAMPITSFEQKFKKALRYNDHVTVHAKILEWQYPSLEVHYCITDILGKKIYASGKSRQIYFDVEKSEIFYEVPNHLLARFSHFAMDKQDPSKHSSCFG